MSQENVEVVRLAFERLNASEPIFSLFHPGLVYHPRTDEPDPYAHVGREAFERLVLGFLESFRELRFDVVELIDAGSRVIASTVMRGQGSASGVGVDDTYVFVYELRDGLVVEGWEYKTRQEALKAVGLSEQPVSQENVELHRRAVEAFNARDVEAFIALCDPSIEAHSVFAAVAGAVYHGHSSARAPAERPFP